MEIKDTTEKKRLQEYIATIQNIAENTSALGSEQESFLESVRGLKQSLESGVYRVAVVGEFSTGKSTFINALMGEKILYASNKEATGAVTAIRRGDKAYVNIYTKDNSMIEKFSLDNEEGKEKLNEYLDINSGKNAGYVEINYPITEIDENIYFVDTPGIEKMSPQQMELTRDALKNANAIIFLIKKEGFTEPALKIITGKHEVIGKIPSKDIFVVMTHMSDIYQQMEKDVSKKISELKRKVEKILAENQLEDVKVYPVDSIDYLLGRNTELYEQEKADHDISLKGQMLSQDEYLKRSGFGVFLAELFDFLQEDTRQKNLLTDIKDKFSILINSLLEELQKEQDGLSDNRKEKYNSNKKNIELAQEARRKTYNAIIRNIKDMLNKTLEDLEEEYKSYYPITQTERIYINGLFKQIEDLSDDNLQKCIQNTKKEIEQIIKKKESRINEIIKGISDEYIKKVFQDTILSTYKLEKLYSDIKIPTNRYHIDLKDKEDRDISFEDDDKKFLKDRVGEIQQSIEQNLSEKNKFSEEIKKLENKIEQQKRKSDLRYRKGLGELGTRPEPKQKYKTIKVKKFFFIKETKCVPDGLDRSEQYKWDEQKNRLDEQRDIDEKNINDLKRAVSMQQLRIKQLVRKDKILRMLEEIQIQIGDNELKDAIVQKQTKLKNDRFVVSVFGHFSNGKSTFLNALMGFGEEILTEDDAASTATITRLRYASEDEGICNKAEIEFSSGNTERVGIKDLGEYVARNNSREVETTIKQVILYLNSELLKNGVEIVDTPGFNSTYKMHTETALRQVEESDAAIFLFNCENPGKTPEIEFLKKIQKYMDRVFFLMNKYEKSNSQGKEEMEDLKRKLKQQEIDMAGKEIYPISALEARKGIAERNEALREHSNMDKFKSVLEDYLVSDENVTDRLLAPLTSIRGTLGQYKNSLSEQISACSKDHEELQTEIKY